MVFLPLIIAIILWLIGLTVVFYRLLAHYRRIASHISEGDLITLIKKLLDSNEKREKDIATVKADIQNIEKHMHKPVQKVGLKKYNPFGETGGDQSFSLCLLDMDENGFVLTSLHTRDRTRVYIKPIVSGSSKYDLSDEEKLALKSALK